MRKLMILGAGIYQVPLIKRAKALGLETLVVSIPGPYPGFALADRIFHVNTTDSEAVLALARQEKIDGICVCGTDVALVTLGRVCEALGLPGPSAAAAAGSCDKILMKEAYRAHGVPTAAFCEVAVAASTAEVQAVCQQLGYPVIFKAVDSSGSRGITRVNGPNDIAKALVNVKRYTHSRCFLIEQFLVGEEFGAQAFIQNGHLEFVLPSGDYVYTGDTGVPIGHFAPFTLPGVSEQDVYDITAQAVTAMGLDNCAINADYILSRGQIYVLEIGARAGATCLVEQVSLFYGFDYYEKIIRVCLGESVSFAPGNQKRQPNANMLLQAPANGILRRQSNENPPADWLREVQFDYPLGSSVRAFRLGPDRIGHVIVTGDSLEQAQTNLRSALDHIHIEVE